jgi:uncharacterized protein DUF11
MPPRSIGCARSVGPATATHVQVKDVLPAGVTLVSATASQGSCTGTTCALGSLAKYASATVMIVVEALCAAMTLTDTASAWADQKDPSSATARPRPGRRWRCPASAWTRH